jgi:hypothetical protein
MGLLSKLLDMFSINNFTTYVVIYSALIVLFFFLVRMFVKFLLKKRDQSLVSQNSDSLEDNLIAHKPPTVFYFWAIFLSFFTMLVPGLSIDPMGAIVLLFTFPLLIICWVVLLLLINKYKNTASQNIRKSIYFLMFSWTIILVLVYSPIILEVLFLI